MLEVCSKGHHNNHKIAIVDCDKKYTYQMLVDRSQEVASVLLNGNQDLCEARVAFIVDPSFDYVALQWGIWLAGGIAVPLCVKHPYPSLKYVLEDTQAQILIYSSSYLELIAPVFNEFSIRTIQTDQLKGCLTCLPLIDPSRRAMILYTSGTTGHPKGVVSTHKNILAQVKSLVDSWEITSQDRILNVLPLHHVHGIINALCCPLFAGGCIEFLPKFKESLVFEAFLKQEVNFFMAVPTIYYKLITYFNELDDESKNKIKRALKTFRVMISGSSALPVSTLMAWKDISGQILLERYGMTEMGMAISNPLHGERKPGFIGLPLPGVELRLVDDENKLTQEGPGEIQIKGDIVFKEYWQKPIETAETFVDGWFKTGDIALKENGYYKILGRRSVDIIKTGGYKVSALEIEEVLRQREDVEDCGVVGLPNDEWGEIIGAAIIYKSPIDQEALNLWLIKRLPNYKLPRKYLFLKEFPRNVLGKVIKKDLQKEFKNS